jgi:hypothetical protein
VLVPLAADKWLVRFEGFGPEYDQEVTADRFRTPGAPAEASPAAAPAAPAPAAAGSPAASPAGAPAAQGALKPNDEVLVAHRGAFHPAVIVGPGAGGKWRVRYSTSAVGNEQSLFGSDEEVAEGRVNRAPAPEKGAQYQINQRVFVEWHGLYFPGRVAKVVDKGQYRIRFENFGPEADEVVPARRIRTRP